MGAERQKLSGNARGAEVVVVIAAIDESLYEV